MEEQPTIVEEQRTIEECIREIFGNLNASLHDKYIGLLRDQDVFYQKDLALLTEDDLIGGCKLPLLPARKLAEAQLLKPPAEGEPGLKKTKRSPAEHLDSEAALDEEYAYIQDLLAPPPELPKTAAELREFLARKQKPLPVVSPDTLMSIRSRELVKLYSPGELGVAMAVESAWTAYGYQRRPNNEADSSHKLRILTGGFLESLNDLAGPGEKLTGLESTLGSARVPGSASASSALLPLMRPDFSLYLNDALILRWENKIDSAHFSLAMEENCKKLKVWSPLFYAELPYVIGGCCGGRYFQWLKLSPMGKDIVAEPVSKKYDLWTLGCVAELLHSVVQIHRLLQRLRDTMTTIPLKLYKEIKRDNGGTVLLCPEHVLKTLEPALEGDRVRFLQSLYESITGSKYLIQLEGKIRCTRNTTKLELYPVGSPCAKPFDLKQLQNAMHDMLHGLADLHRAGYTHRDIRWENCIRQLVQSEWKWIIIDLEFAGQDGEIWEGEGLVTWDSRTLQRNRKYTKRSDLYQFGKLIVNWLDESGAISEEKDRIRALGEKMKVCGEAAKMLGDVCPKRCARCAKF